MSRFGEAAAAYANPTRDVCITSVSSIEEKPNVPGMYPVIVTDTHSALIPGVGDDCGLEDRFSKRLVCCQNSCSGVVTSSPMINLSGISSRSPAEKKHDYYEVGGTSCGRPGCPRHWKTWAHQGADRIGCRLEGWKIASKGRHNPRHTVLSLNDDDPIVLSRIGKSDKANVRFFRKYFIKQAFELGGLGGSAVVHLWRANDDVPDRVDAERKWDWIRKKGYFWKNFVKFSPHAHLIGYGFYQEPEKKVFWYKNFPALEDRDAIESVAYYQLSHAPVGVGNAVVYWGCCRPGYLNVVTRFDGKKAKGYEHKSVFCKMCGALMVFDDCGEEYLKKRSWAIYEILDKGPP